MEGYEFQRGLEWFGRMERVEGEVRLGLIQDNLARWWSWGLDFQWGLRQLGRREIQWAEPQVAGGWVAVAPQHGWRWQLVLPTATEDLGGFTWPWWVQGTCSLEDPCGLGWLAYGLRQGSPWPIGSAQLLEYRKRREEGEGGERGQRQAGTVIWIKVKMVTLGCMY